MRERRNADTERPQERGTFPSKEICKFVTANSTSFTRHRQDPLTAVRFQHLTVNRDYNWYTLFKDNNFSEKIRKRKIQWTHVDQCESQRWFYKKMRKIEDITHHQISCTRVWGANKLKDSYTRFETEFSDCWIVSQDQRLSSPKDNLFGRRGVQIWNFLYLAQGLYL